MMWTVVFFATMLFCAAKWLVTQVAMMAFIKYILDKGFPLPSDEAFGKCCDYAWRQLLHIR